MRLTNKVRGAAVAALAATALAAWAPPALATGPDGDAVEAAEIAAEAAEIAVALTGDVPFDEAPAGGDAAVSETEDMNVVVPRDAANDSVVVASDDGELDVGVTFPVTESVEDAEVVDGDIVYTDEAIDTSFVVDAREDGLRMMSVLGSSDAPHEISYELDIPEGARLILRPDGSIDIGGETGNGGWASARLAAPWAVDADGRFVDTWYEVSGSTVTQVVAPDGYTTYPVVADPYLGKALLALWYRACDRRYSSGSCQYYRHGFQLSNWGETVYRDHDATVLMTHGWTEAKGKYSTVGRYTTTKNQWDCHVLGHWTGRTGSFWDLEEWRRASTSTYDWIVRSCNW